MARRSVSRHAAASAAALLIASCSASQEAPTSTAQPTPTHAHHEGFLLNQASYTLAWDTAGTTLLPDGSRALSTDLGYTLQLHQGYLISWNTSLAICDGLTASRISPAVRLFDLLLGASPAHAGHSSNLDPSTASGPFAESITQAAPLELTVAPFSRGDYCRFHYAIGNAGVTLEDAPEELDLTLTSLYLELSWQRPDGTQVERKLLQTSTAYGLLLNLRELGAHEPLDGQEHAHITLKRPLAHLFDGLDLDTLEEEDLLRGVLRNLSSHTAVQLELIAAPDAQNDGE